MNKLMVFLMFFAGTAMAAGPEKIATFDRALWPEQLSSAAAFDRASRFEIYQFLHQLEPQVLDDEAAVSDFTGVSKVNLDSVKRWKGLTEERLLAAFTASCSTLSEAERVACRKVESVEALRAWMRPQFQALEETYAKWKTDSASFHRRYLYEQVRLAALFPRITSEILTLSADEFTGYEMADKHFLLTYDDGPSNGDASDRIVQTLERQGKNAVFFVLGNQFTAATSERVAGLYDGQCIGSHGSVHKPHPKYSAWRSSIDDSYALIETKLGKSTDGMWFRPPYGQRNEAIDEHLMAKHQARAMLWNIDSQDWNRKVDAKAVRDRVVTLMLLWRKGVVLFHDLYDKSVVASGELLQFATNNSIDFVDCKTLRRSSVAER